MKVVKLINHVVIYWRSSVVHQPFAFNDVIWPVLPWFGWWKSCTPCAWDTTFLPTNQSEQTRSNDITGNVISHAKSKFCVGYNIYTSQMDQLRARVAPYCWIKSQILIENTCTASRLRKKLLAYLHIVWLHVKAFEGQNIALSGLYQYKIWKF